MIYLDCKCNLVPPTTLDSQSLFTTTDMEIPVTWPKWHTAKENWEAVAKAIWKC